MEKLILIDGHSILNRAFYGVPELTNSAGLHTNAVYGFLNILFRILDEENADYLAVAFDLHAPTFRHIEYKEYKGNRKPMPEELAEQVPVIKNVLTSMKIPILTYEGFEADDIIGTVAKRYQAEGLEISIVSGDRDLLQLADEHIRIRIPKTSKGQTQVVDYYPEDVLRDYGVTPLEFIDVKALMGDASDNIPGVASIGEKTATAIISQYHSIENAYANAESIKPPRASKALSEQYDMAVFSKFLATIRLDAPVETVLEDMRLEGIYNAESLDMIKSLEFKSLIKRYSEGMGSESISDEGILNNIFLVDDEKEISEICKKAEKAEKLGIEMIRAGKRNPAGKDSEEQAISDRDEELLAISLCMKEGEAYLLRGEKEFIKNELIRLMNFKCLLYFLRLKPVIKFTGVEERKNLHDLSVASYLINPLKDSYDYDDIARDVLGLQLQARQELIGKKDEESELEKDGVARYAAFKSLTAFLAGGKLTDKLDELGMGELYREIELPLIYSLAAMENAGIRVDAARLREYGDELKKGISALENKIYAETGMQFNINSPKQLGEILFEKMGLPGGKKTKTGYSTAADVLDKLAEEHEVVKHILEYRQLTKLNSTYTEGLAQYIEEDGRIHGSFNQTITATGRISSTEPNLQNIPVRTGIGSRLRDIFVPEDGYLFVDADYSQIELRVLASMSDDEKLIESYKSSADIHASTAAEVFHVPLDEVTPLQRRNAKAVNFGVVYGISAFGLSEDLSISRKEALDYINRYFKTYPGVKLFLDDQVKHAKEKGYVKTMYGRLRPIPEIKSSNFMQRAFGDRVAMNSPIQGTAADIMKIAMINVDRELKKSGLDARIVLQVHDELLIEAEEAAADEVKVLVEKTMRDAAKLKVSLEVDANIGKTWLEAK